MNPHQDLTTPSLRWVTAHLEVIVAAESDLVLTIAVANGHVRQDEQVLLSV